MKIKISCRPQQGMWLKKIISKGLIIGLLFNNLGHSFANTKSLHNRYEIFEGKNITINNVLEEDKVDVEIEGNTYVNILENVEWNSRETYLYNNNIGNYDISGQTITMINFSNKAISLSLNYDNTGFNAQFYRSLSIPANSYVVENIESQAKLRTFVAHAEDGWVQSEDSVNLMNKLVVMIGDYSDKPMPNEYFEGLKSVGELEDNKYKINLKSNNKNLFNGNFEEGYISTDIGTNGDITYSKGYRSTGYIKVKPNTYYTCSKTNRSATTFYDSNKKKVGDSSKNTFLTTEETQYIRCYYYNPNVEMDVNVKLDEFQIEEGLNTTSYIPHKCIEKDIILNSPLKAVSPTIKDRIIKRNSQWIIERNCAEIILDGTEEWKYSLINAPSRKTAMFYSPIISKQIKDSYFNITPDLKSDVFISDSWHNITTNDSENVSISGTNDVGISILKDKLISSDVESFKNWINKNPVKLVYPLADPIYEPLNIDSTINLYEEITHILNDSTIPANMKVTVDRTINRAVEAIELSKENPTINNISLARMWVNLLKESINKDDLQNEINDITQIEDLIIEPKKVSSSLDVYVKSKNSLTMSLSTNSIIFDSFTGVDDMEKLNAVNITVNSSLPYQLNSYMMTELKNEDNTKVIPKELLNIRLNGENDYKAFNNINEKLVLKDDYKKGNNNQFNIDLILKGSLANKADVYKTTLKFEAEQK